jgi:hypothetical protein
MRFNELKYTRRNNLGDYSSEEISLSVLLEEGESPSVIFPKLKGFVLNNLEREKAQSVPAAKAPEARVAVASKPLSAPAKALSEKIAESAKAAGVQVGW